MPPLKVFIVDDNPINLELLELRLKTLDCEVFSASDGEKALELILTRKPDIILLDVMLPQMDGYELCRLLKNHELTKDIPVVFISAAVGETFKEKALHLGALAFLTKPINKEELKNIINEVVRRKEA